MLTIKQNEEIKEHLAKAQNPIFFFDNDQDGLCSFLLLQRYIGRGRGVAAKTFPNLDVSLFRRVLELEADYIFILDKPNVSQEFFEEVRKINLPIVWIDHHQTDTDVPEWVHYYNSFYDNDKTGEPVTDLCYRIADKKEDMWLAVAGCVADSYIPSYYKDFLKENPELCVDTDIPFEILYNSDIGKVSRIIGAGLMDKTTNVVSMLKYLMKVKFPTQILSEDKKIDFVYEKFDFLEKKRAKLVSKAMNEGEVTDKYVYFEYGGTVSMSADLANELVYRYPNRYIIIVYKTGSSANISTRGSGVKNIMIETIKDIDGASGGGHTNAAGGKVMIGDLGKFKEKFLSQL